MPRYTYGKLMFRNLEALEVKISWWSLQFILVGDKIVILISQGLHTEKWVTDTVFTDYSFENCSFCISILYNISSLIMSFVVNTKFLSNSALSPEMTCMWLSTIVSRHHCDTFVFL